jgi:hypothetical protein
MIRKYISFAFLLLFISQYGQNNNKKPANNTKGKKLKTIKNVRAI